jgi:hypothetical protein
MIDRIVKPVASFSELQNHPAVAKVNKIPNPNNFGGYDFQVVLNEGYSNRGEHEFTSESPMHALYVFNWSVQKDV